MIFTIGFIIFVLGYAIYAVARPDPLDVWLHMTRTGEFYSSRWIALGRLAMIAGAGSMLYALGMLAWRWLP